MSARRAEELSNALLLQLLTIPLSYKRLFKEMCHKVWTRGLRLHPPVLIYYCNEHAVMHDYQAIIFGYHVNRVHHGTSLKTEKNSITERELCFQMAAITGTPTRLFPISMNVKRLSVLMPGVSYGMTNWYSIAFPVKNKWWLPSDEVLGVWVRIDLIVQIHPSSLNELRGGGLDWASLWEERQMIDDQWSTTFPPEFSGVLVCKCLCTVVPEFSLGITFTPVLV